MLRKKSRCNLWFRFLKVSNLHLYSVKGAGRSAPARTPLHRRITDRPAPSSRLSQRNPRGSSGRTCPARGVLLLCKILQVAHSHTYVGTRGIAVMQCDKSRPWGLQGSIGSRPCVSSLFWDRRSSNHGLIQGAEQFRKRVVARVTRMRRRVVSRKKTSCGLNELAWAKTAQLSGLLRSPNTRISAPDRKPTRHKS